MYVVAAVIVKLHSERLNFELYVHESEWSSPIRMCPFQLQQIYATPAIILYARKTDDDDDDDDDESRDRFVVKCFNE